MQEIKQCRETFDCNPQTTSKSQLLRNEYSVTKSYEKLEKPTQEAKKHWITQKMFKIIDIYNYLLSTLFKIQSYVQIKTICKMYCCSYWFQRKVDTCFIFDTKSTEFRGAYIDMSSN